MSAKKDQELAIKVWGLHKEFVLPQHKHSSVKQAFVNVVQRNNKTIQKVLDGVEFEVEKGDFFGVVGRNGSGKSTLLKLLAGVYSPTSGAVEINGQLTPFIELGVGFNPELSGRDNVFLNGALLGFSRDEMQAMYDEIVEFAELEPFMDQKLKNYSSGMQVRLAFSIAIKAHNDILIFDEVLAVGDEAFQRKCLDVFEKYKAERQTVILVTHDMDTVKKFCNKAILVDKGKILERGNPYKVANLYSELNQAQIDEESHRTGRSHESKLQVALLDATSKSRHSFSVNDKVRIRVKWEGLPELESVGINIFKTSGEHITGFNSRFAGSEWRKDNELQLDVVLNVRPGSYYTLVEAYKEEGVVADALLEGPRFSVVEHDGIDWSGLTELDHSWR